MLVPSLRSITKTAEAPYPDMHSLAAQQYAPIQGRREFSPEELEVIERDKSRFLPKIWQSYQTPASRMLASPGKQTLGVGLGAGAIGAGAGGLLGARFFENSPYSVPVGATLGGLGVGGLAALLTYFSRKQSNENIEEIMRRLPPGATRRDILSDAVYQKDRDLAELRARERAQSARGAGILGAILSQ